jgi:hypothetical protein
MERIGYVQDPVALPLESHAQAFHEVGMLRGDEEVHGTWLGKAQVIRPCL